MVQQPFRTRDGRIVLPGVLECQVFRAVERPEQRQRVVFEQIKQRQINRLAAFMMDRSRR